MSILKGHTSSQQMSDTDCELVQVQPVGALQNAVQTFSFLGGYQVANDAAESGSTTSVIKATAHSAQRGDIIRFTSGTANTKQVWVTAVLSDWIYLGEVLSAAPGAGDTFQILRHRPLELTSAGEVKISGSITATGGDGAITDGVSSSIKATVFDYTNSNPIATTLVDTNGDYVAVGGGTQYTEDAATPANPVGNALQGRRRDSLTTETTTDGDWVTVNATNKGELYVKHVDAIPVTDNGSTLSIDDGGGSITIDGTVTATGTVATTQSGTWDVRLQDGVGNDLESSVSTPAGTEQALIVRNIPSGTQTVSGSVNAVQSGTWNIGTLTSITNAVTVQDGGSTISIDDGGSSITVDGTVAVSGSVSITGAVTTEIPDAATLADDTANPSTPSLGAFAMMYDGSTWDRVRGTSADGMLVNLGANNDVTVTGTVTANIGTGTADINVKNYNGSAVGAGNAVHVQPGTGAVFPISDNGSSITVDSAIDASIFTDDAAFTVGTSKIQGIGFLADETSTDSVDEGDIGAARITLDRKQIVTTQPHTAGGLSIFRSLDIDESEEEIKGSAGCVYGMWVTNTATSTRWIKFYNATAASVTVGSTTPVITWGIPGNSSDDISAVFGSGNGIQFDTAITVAATTGVADADTGAPAANDVIINVFYK